MKTELIKKAKISTNAMAKLGRNEDVRGRIVYTVDYLEVCLIMPEKLELIILHRRNGC